MMGILGTPLGWVMRMLYTVIGSYGWTLILFTILIRLLSFPLNVKSQISSAKMQMFQPKIQKLQKQYKNDKDKLNREMMKLQEEEGYNPFSSCLPMVLQMVILFGIIEVVYKPLKYILQVPADMIAAATETLKEAGVAPNMIELSIINILQGTDTSVNASILDGIFSSDIVSSIMNFNMHFLGLDLGDKPVFGMSVTIIIPLLSGVTSLLMTLMTMRNQKKNGVQQTSGVMNGMMYIMPVFSTVIAFSFPIGIGLYWAIGNIFMIFANMVLYRVWSPEKVRIKIEKEQEDYRTGVKKKKKKSKFKQALAEAQRQQAEQQAAKGTSSGKELPEPERVSEKGLTQSQKIALARKRMAEKYGDEYND